MARGTGFSPDPAGVGQGSTDDLPEPESAEKPEAYTPGSSEDFDRLYRTSYKRVRYTLVGVLGDYGAAEDCAQEAFVRAFAAWKDWKPDAPAEAWLHRIALNVAFSYRRWGRLREVGELIRRFGAPETHAHTPDPGLRIDLLDALNTLPPEQAATIMLRHYHGYTNREIAVALDVPESTVASRLVVAKQRLREKLS